MLLLLLACSSEPPPCDTPECRRDALLALWERDAQAGRAAFDALEDPLDQRMVVQGLSERFPAATEALCPSLSPQDRQWCDRLNERAHMWNTRSEPLVRKDRPAGGPNTAWLLVSEGVGSSWEVTAEPGECSDDACLRQAAKGLGETDVRGAADVCAAVQDERHRQECWFGLAEQALKQRGAEAYPDSVQLCLLAGDYSRHCLSHSLQRLALQLSPDATHSSAGRWKASVQVAEQVRAVWDEVDPPLSDQVVDGYWSALLAQSFTETEVSGNARVYLPPEALPHFRAAAAYRYLELYVPRDLESAQSELEGLLAQRPEPGERPHRRRTTMGEVGAWRADEAGDEVRPAVLLWMTSRRTWSEDPSVDLAICLVEAAYRVRPELLPSALEHPEEPVRWTAERLSALPEAHLDMSHQPGKPPPGTPSDEGGPKPERPR